MQSELKDTIRIARNAGKILLKYFGKSCSKTKKADHTWVTEADLKSQAYISRELQKKYKDPILGEEGIDSLLRLKQKRVWLVDPLDGTNNFIRKDPDFSVLIGLAERGKPVLGVVYLPVEDTIYYAEIGKGAYKQTGKKPPVKIHVSDRKKTSELWVVTGPRLLVPAHNIRALRDLGLRKLVYRGSIGIRLCLIAEGTADLQLNRTGKGNEWDTCAPEIILKEAGGKITDVYGKPFKYNQKDVKHKYGLVASNGLIHTEVLKKIKPQLPVLPLKK